MPDNESDEKTGMVLRIERSSIYDGEGFRTVVFLKGCPLRCLWCSTPESQSFETERAGDNVYGTRMGVEQLMKEIRKDSVFYFHSGGGLTLSGGEPLSQADFSAELLRRAHDEGINTAMETSLAASFVQVGKTLPHLDVVYADLKHVDPEKHKKFCGAPNMMILQNIRRIDEMGGPARLIVRVPVVPGINDDEESLSGMAAFCSELKNLHGVQLLPYHRLGIDTYRKLGRNYPLNSLQRPGDAHMEHCRAIFRRHVGEVQSRIEPTPQNCRSLAVFPRDPVERGFARERGSVLLINTHARENRNSSSDYLFLCRHSEEDNSKEYLLKTET